MFTPLVFEAVSLERCEGGIVVNRLSPEVGRRPFLAVIGIFCNLLPFRRMSRRIAEVLRKITLLVFFFRQRWRRQNQEKNHENQE